MGYSLASSYEACDFQVAVFANLHNVEFVREYRVSARSRLQSMKNDTVWNETELKLAILQVLLLARKKHPANGGATGKMLMDCLNLKNIDELDHAIKCLFDAGSIEVGERRFMITALGVDYLAAYLPPSDPPSGANGPPDPWPDE